MQRKPQCDGITEIQNTDLEKEAHIENNVDKNKNDE